MEESFSHLEPPNNASKQNAVENVKKKKDEFTNNQKKIPHMAGKILDSYLVYVFTGSDLRVFCVWKKSDFFQTSAYTDPHSPHPDTWCHQTMFYETIESIFSEGLMTLR